MAETHYVAQGEYLSKIARSYGFADYHVIWDAPENQDLKEKRKNPNILYPGDKLTIPERETKEETGATEKKHKFELQTETLQLRIVLMGFDRKPMAGHQCRLSVESSSKDLTTKSDGLLEDDVPEGVSTGKVVDSGKPGTDPPLDRQIPLKIGHLDPVETVTGQMARLNNLGYSAGEIPEHPLSKNEAEAGASAPQFLSAVEEFQCDFMGQNDLATIKQVVDGKCGPKTQAKLAEVHGC